MLCPHSGPQVTLATSEAVWKKLMIKSPSAAWSPGKTNSWVRAIGHSTLKNTIQSQSWKTNTNFTPTNPVLSPVSLLFRLFRDQWILTGLITKNNFGKLIACHLNASLCTYKKYIGLKKNKIKHTYQHNLQSATPDTGHKEKRWHKQWSQRNAVRCCTTCTPCPGWCSWHSWCAENKVSCRMGGNSDWDFLHRRQSKMCLLQIRFLKVLK